MLKIVGRRGSWLADNAWSRCGRADWVSYRGRLDGVKHLDWLIEILEGRPGCGLDISDGVVGVLERVDWFIGLLEG